MNLKVKKIYDPGTATPLEDKFIVKPPFYGVFDGVSGLYDPNIGPRRFQGLSGGQMVVRIIEETFKAAKPSESLYSVLRNASKKIREFAHREKLDIRAGQQPGADFAAVKIGREEIEIVQAAASFAVVLLKNGKIVATPNQNYHFEKIQFEIMERIVRKYKGDKKLIWPKYLPIAIALRKNTVNRKTGRRYVLINGQKVSEALWYRRTIPRDQVKLILLFTDGMTDFRETKNAQKMAKTMVSTYQKSGLQGMLKRSRKLESKDKNRYLAHAEATAISIEF